MLHLKDFKLCTINADTDYPFEEYSIDGTFDGMMLVVASKFQEDTYKVLYRSMTGEIRAITKVAKDIEINGPNLSVLEVEELPEKIKEYQRFIVDHELGVIIEADVIDTIKYTENQTKQDNQIVKTTAHIEDIKARIKFGKEADASLIELYELYRMAVIDTDIKQWEPKWPESPFSY